MPVLAQSPHSPIIQTACSFASSDSPDSNLDQITSVVGLYDDTGRAFGAGGRSLVALGSSVSRFAGPIGTALSAVQTASQVNNGQYLDAAFTTTDFLLAAGLSLTGPVGIAADVGLNAAGGTKAAAMGAASLICQFGGGP